MAYQFPKDPYDGQSAEIKQPNGTEFIYTYNKAQNTWELAGQGVDLDQNNIVIYTDNVLARGSRPAANERNTNYKNNRNDSTFSALNNQQDINWVLHDAINLVEGSTKVWIDNIEPPDETYQFWWHTETLELLFKYNDQWWPVSIPPDQVENLTQALTDLQRDTMLNKLANDQLRRDIIAGDFRPNLEQVLTQGNVADKGILLTDAEDALIAIAPNEALIDIASDTSKKNPRLRLTHIDKLNYPDAQAQIELDQDGTRVDFEFDQAINDVHFRFDDTEKFVLNKNGDAQFIGKVQGEPGTQNNEFVTFGQLTTLEEEIEQLAPSLERGSWNFTLNHPPGPGEYTMISGFLSEEDQQALCTQAYTQCYADNMDDPVGQQQCSRDLETCQNAVTGDQVLTTDDWTQCEQLVFNPQDSKGVTHEWNGIDSDHYIDVFNEADEGFMVGDIATHGGGTFAFDLVSSRGVASGLASVKIFKAEGEVDFDQYVRKAGDDMTGPLHIKADTSDSNPAFLLEPDNTSSSYSDIMQVRNNEGTLLFYVTNGGTVSSGGSSGYKPSADHHLATKKYVDDQDTIFKPAKYGWKVGINSTNTPAQGYVSCSKGRIEGGVKFKFNLKSMEGGFNMKPFSPSGDVTSKEIYRYTGSSGAMTAMVLTAWVYQSGGTQMWKGTGEVRDILLKEDCLEVSLNSHYKNNGTDFDSSSIYYFTIGGFF